MGVVVEIGIIGGYVEGLLWGLYDSPYFTHFPRPALRLAKKCLTSSPGSITMEWQFK
jgi:hypothetical protein